MRNRTKRNFGFEQLETRRLLAGNITTLQQGNVLTIFGDDASNGIAVYNSSPGVVQLLGLNGTTITGTTLFTNVTGINFNFNAGLSGVNKGDDVIVVTNLSLSAGIAVAAADGNIIVALGQFDNSGGLVDSAVNSHLGAVSIGNGLGITLGSGTNTVVANNVAVNGGVGLNFVIVSGVGTNTFTLNNFSVAHAALINDFGPLSLNLDGFNARNLTIAGSIGNDSISLSNCAIVQKLIIGSTFGNDLIELDHVASGSLNVALGPGIDQFSADSLTIAHAVTIDGGADGDAISFSNSTAGGFTNIIGGDGADSITLTGFTTNKLTVSGGADNDTISLTTVDVIRVATLNGGLGNDTANLNTLRATTLFVRLGDSSDQVDVADCTVLKANFFGGIGLDTYSDSGGNTFGTVNRKSFETII